VCSVGSILELQFEVLHDTAHNQKNEQNKNGSFQKFTYYVTNRSMGLTYRGCFQVGHKRF
jgi:hypothetical protein